MEQTGTPLPGAIGQKVKVDGETGGAWLLYTNEDGPAFAWSPNSEGVLNFLVTIGAVSRQEVDITQEAFDELTDDNKLVYIPIRVPKP